MRSIRNIYAVDSHTMGEPLRLVVGGFPNLIGNSIPEKREYFIEHYDYLRKAIMLEPRGHRDMFGAILTQPTMPEADIGVIFMHGEGYHNMCGHGTIATNTKGLENLLSFAAKAKAQRFEFLSSVEVYGQNRGDVELFAEDYCGYIDCNTLRAGYPESKRLGEALCQAYIKQEGLDVVIPRLSRVYGPTLLESDTKALSQFLKKGLAHEDIVLKSEGTQKFSYTHCADAVGALLACLLEGECGAAYNVADPGSDVTLRELAESIAKHAGTKVVFQLPSETEREGYSTATKAMMDGSKLKALGWQPHYTIGEGIEQTLLVMGRLQAK